MVEDAAVGFTAVAAAFGASIWRISTLSIDSGSRQWRGSWHRSFVVPMGTPILCAGPRCELPLTKLGGSTALIDATCAVMLGFAESPLFTTSVDNFDPSHVLRLCSSPPPRFTAACLRSRVAPFWRASQRRYARHNTGQVLAGVRPGRYFCADSMVPVNRSVAILLADVFSVPFAHSLTRTMANSCSKSRQRSLPCGAAGLPQLMKTVQYLAREDPRVRVLQVFFLPKNRTTRG